MDFTLHLDLEGDSLEQVASGLRRLADLVAADHARYNRDTVLRDERGEMIGEYQLTAFE